MHANQPPIPVIPKLYQKTQTGAVTDANGTILPPYNTAYYDQSIDHKNPSKGTFTNTGLEFYEPGGPILVLNPGEKNVDNEGISSSYCRIARVLR